MYLKIINNEYLIIMENKNDKELAEFFFNLYADCISNQDFQYYENKKKMKCDEYLNKLEFYTLKCNENKSYKDINK